jgi:hypothetical protein
MLIIYYEHTLIHVVSQEVLHLLSYVHYSNLFKYVILVLRLLLFN